MKLLVTTALLASAAWGQITQIPGGGGGGGGGVSSVATGCGLTGGTITTTGTLQASSPVRAQTGTTYTVLDADCGKLVTTTNAAAIAITLPQAGGGGEFVSGWVADFQNRGVGTATITPTTSTIDGAASLALTTGQGVRIFSNGTDFFTQRGIGGSGGAGTVTSVAFTGGLISVANPTGAAALTVAGTSGGVPYFASSSTWASSSAWTANTLMKGGGAGVAPAVTGITVDSSDNLSSPGGASFGVGSGLAGYTWSTAGTAPTLLASSWTWAAGAAAPAGGAMYLYPATAGTGFMLATNSSGTHTISHVSSNGTGNVLLSAGTAAIASGKTLTASNSITLAGTDSTTMTFPSTSATITRTVASGAKTLNTTAVGSAACGTVQTDTATGTLTTDAIIASFNGDPTAVTGYVPLTAGMLTLIIYPTADTFNVKVCNNTSSSITPGAVTLNWRVVR